MPSTSRISPKHASEQPLLIQANFGPSRKIRRLKTLMGLATVVAGVSLLLALGVYAINVHLVTQMNDVGTKTREINEANKDLTVRLNKIKAYKNIEASAARLSHLKPADEVIEIHIPKKQLEALKDVPVKPAHPFHQGEQARVYGY